MTQKLEKARKLYQTANADQKYVLEKLFPELKESEDERIRKSLITFFQRFPYTNLYNAGPNTKEVIAWLEKRGEQKPFDYENANIQQKDFAPKSEPKFKVKYAGNEYNVLDVKDIAGVTYYGIEDEPNHIDYVLPDNCEVVGGYSIKENGFSVPTKPIMFSEQKPAWSEEDEIGLVDAMWAIEQARTIAKDENDMGNLWYAEKWLKSLKDRMKG